MNKLYAVLYPVVWFIFSIFHPCRVIGRERLPEGGVLLCGNHSALSDPLFVVCAVGHKPQLRIMAKAELLRIPILGFLLKKAGIFGVERGKSDVGAIKEAMKTLKAGQPLLLFPEGTRVRDGGEGEAHTGAAMLSTRTDVPILPVYIPTKKKWFRPITLVFGEPYKPTYEGKKPTPEDYRRIAEDLLARIYALKEQAQ